MPDEVILDVTTIQENVTVETTAGDVVEIQVVAPAGPAGATGPAGPNSVTSATTSDGTANLSIADLEVVGGEIYTDGEYSSIYTQGATAHIFTLGSGAEIFTEGELAQIYTTGASAQIYTAGAGATIGTQGANATIYTQGTNATISTAGSAAHIQTSHASAAVKSTNFAAVESGGASLVDGSMQPCLTWSAGGRNLTIPSGTATTFNTTSYTYGTGAAAAHRTALGLTTLATTTPAANVANFLEFPTSANLASALTDETGTGSLVFSNAPTFTGGLQFSSSAVAATTRTNLGVLQTRSVTKASDETRTSTTLAADSDLVISLEANSIYKIELYYFHTITNGTISARADYTGTLLDTLAGDTCGVYHGTSSGRWTWATVSPPVTSSWANGSATTPAAWIFTFSVKTDTAGNFRLMWSAGNGAGGSSGTAIIKQGSRIIATKLL